jgi:hypothetical protein
MTTLSAQSPGPATAPPALLRASIRLSVRPADAIASRVRELLTVVYGDFLDPDETQSIAMAAHELLENVVKYGGDGESSFEVAVIDHGDGASVRLQTTNLAAPEHIDDLRCLVDRIRDTLDPVGLYDELIASSVHREGSGLGLARIRAEGGMDLACSVELGRIAVVAERRVSIRRPE